MYLMKEYDNALQEILDHGVERTNKRTGIKTLSIFGILKRYRLDAEYFPLVTKRKIWPKSVFAELLWFLSGSTSNKDLTKMGCNFWTPWVEPEFEKKNGFEPESFGPVYGFQLRHFGGSYNKGIQNEGYGHGGFDQLKWVIERIKEDPSCRRTLWTLWNPKDLAQMRLPPCHMLTQIFVDDERRLTLLLYQRSCDFPVGVIANIQFYSALAIMIAQQTDCTPHEFVHVTGDSHIYEDQITAVKAYLALPEIPSPKLEIKKAKDIFSYQLEDFVLSDFTSGPKLEIPVAV
jgi:thymidylate synthase